MHVWAFVLAQLAVLAVFVVFISDFRRKGNMIPLIGERWTFLLKASYLVPLAAYVWVLFTLESLMVFDWVAFGVTLVGTALVVKAKRDLAAHHTWTGYCLPNSKFISNGIYAYIRHPLYTGIYIVVLGAFFTVVPHVNWQATSTLAVTSIICMAYIMGFLAFLANKETKLLMTIHGKPFKHYKNKVHPCLPLRKYNSHPTSSA